MMKNSKLVKASLKSYCQRALGYGVIDINVSDDQIDDRIDEALQYFAQYHYDGIERMYLKHLITEAEVTRARSNASSSVTDTADSSVSATWKEGTNYIPVPSAVLSVALSCLSEVITAKPLIPLI